MFETLRLTFVFALGMAIGAHIGIRAAFRAVNKALAIKHREDGPHAAL
jgi:hypothetical protein